MRIYVCRDGRIFTKPQSETPFNEFKEEVILLLLVNGEKVEVVHNSIGVPYVDYDARERGHMQPNKTYPTERAYMDRD